MPAKAAQVLPAGTTRYIGVTSGPGALAMDPFTRTIYYTSRSTNGVLRKISAQKVDSQVTGDFTSVTATHSAATDLLYWKGNLYTVVQLSSANGFMVKIDASTGATSTVGGVPYVGSNAGFAAGDNSIYFTDGDGSDESLRELAAVTYGGESVRLLSHIFSLTYGLEFDAPRKRFFIANSGSGFYRCDVYKYPVPGHTLISSAATGAGNFAVDPNGRYLYVRVGTNINRIGIVDGVSTPYATELGGDDSYDLIFGPASSGSGSSLYVGDADGILEIPGFQAAGGRSDIGPRTLLTNGSFENGMTGWQVTNHLASQFPVAARANGFNPGSGFPVVTATDGGFAASFGLYGNGPGVTTIGQSVTVTSAKPCLVFDYRAAWDASAQTPTFQTAKAFRVVVRDAAGGNQVQASTQLTIYPRTKNFDAGPMTGVVDLGAFAGQTIYVSWELEMPDASARTGFFQLDNVGFAAMTSSAHPAVASRAPILNGSSSVTLQGTVNANGLATNAYFEFGSTPDFGTKVPVTVPTTSTPTAVSLLRTTFPAGQPFYYRLVATNREGAGISDTATFTVPGPLASTGAEGNVTWASAMVNGTINPMGSATTGRFEYGLTTAYGSSVDVALGAPGGTTVQNVAAQITGLRPATTYHFRLRASNVDGTSYGDDRTFTTGGGMSVSTIGGWNDGFFYPHATAVAPDGTVFVSDMSVHAILKVSPGGGVSIFAGASRTSGYADGNGGAARFNTPGAIARDSVGNIFVADSGNQVIRKITPEGDVTTFAGLAGVAGSADGHTEEARFRSPWGIAIDGGGNLWITDTFNSTIRKITPTADVTTIAGSANQSGSVDGIGANARFNYPMAIAVNALGEAYVADRDNDAIRKISPTGEVTTFAGVMGSPGSADGPGATARFDSPGGVAIDAAGNIHVGDSMNRTIRRITPDGIVGTIAGFAPLPGSYDGVGSAARFSYPVGISLDAAGNLYVADRTNNSVRKLVPQGNTLPVVSLVGGTPLTVEAGAAYLDPGATAGDGEDGVLVPQITSNSVIANKPGTYAVTWMATDTGGLPGSATRTVHVVDTTAPSITVPATIFTPSTGSNGAVVNFSVSASDIVDGAVSVASFPLSGAIYPNGTTTVSLSAQDAAGNTRNANFKVVVIPPIGSQETAAPASSMSGGNLNFGVPTTVVGRIYQLQYRASLSSGGWEDLGPEHVGDGRPLQMAIPVQPDQPFGFYRFRLR